VKLLERDRIVLINRLIRWGYTDPPGRFDYRYESVTDDRLADDLATYQRFHIVPLENLCLTIHHRSAVCDGIMGPATGILMDSRTCDVPDRLPGHLLQEARWPDGCKDDITISWNFDKEPGLTEEQTQQVWESVPEEFNRLFDMTVVLKKDQYPETRIAAILKSLPGPTLAWSYKADNNCSSRLRQAYDNTTTWSVNLATGVRKHECGHALGLDHTPNDPDSLMYPSMRGQTKLNETDIDQMVRIGYRRRDGDPPTKPPPVPKRKLSVVVTVDGKPYQYAWALDDQPFPM